MLRSDETGSAMQCCQASVRPLREFVALATLHIGGAAKGWATTSIESFSGQRITWLPLVHGKQADRQNPPVEQ